MTRDEVDSFLAQQRTCRVATVSRSGQPHVTPLWFAWDGAALWLYSIVDSQRWTDLTHDARISVVVDDGAAYGELRGVEIVGTAMVVGEVPRTDSANPELAAPERLFSEKYFAGTEFVSDGRHAWVRITPTTARSWDFRKIPARPSP
ncbi:pyridoxamine 5'-phosphate oxidase family protein [Mycobacterium sp. C31M]